MEIRLFATNQPCPPHDVNPDTGQGNPDSQGGEGNQGGNNQGGQGPENQQNGQ